MKKPVVFSGIQPTGNLHLGNYLGAVQQWIEIQNSGAYDCFFCIADYHSLAGNLSPDGRREHTLALAAELLSLGIDPRKSTLFVQSDVPEHTELAWIFETLTPVSELDRMTQFKDKSARQEKNVNAGLFTYPVLQAADILLYRGEHVPVGQDQIQHVELTRDIARWFNNRYGAYFPETKHLLAKTPKVMSILEPAKKMSKSLGEGHVIELADEPDAIEKKIKKAVTATSGGASSPGAENLLLLLQQFGPAEAYAKFSRLEREGGIQYGELKSAVAAALADSFADFRSRRAGLLKKPRILASVLEKGARQAGRVARKTMEDVRRMVGVR